MECVYEGFMRSPPTRDWALYESFEPGLLSMV